MKDKKGFTLAELLIVIVIIIIIALMTIPSVIKILDKNKNEKYTSYEKLLVENMKLYKIDNSEDLGENIDTHLSLNILKKTNPDIKITDCVVDDLYIKQENYNVCLRCDYNEETNKYSYESKYCKDENIPYGKPPTTPTVVKSISSNPSSGYLTAGKTITIELSLTRQVTGSYPTLTILAGSTNINLTGALDNNKLIYSYTVKDGDNGKFNIVSLNGGTLKDVENEEDVSLELPVFSNNIVLDTIEPTCNLVMDNKRIVNNVETVDLVINGSDANLDNSGYSWDNNSYSNTLRKAITIDGKYTGYVKDLANNIGMCSTNVLIDKESPTITANVSSNAGKAIITVTIKDNENLTGYQEGTFDSASDNWTSIENAKEKTITLTKDKAGTYYVYAKDEYGHITKVSYEVKVTDIDNTPPVLTFSIDDNHTTATGTCSDPESGIEGNTTFTQALSGTSNVDVSFTCTNAAGLSTTETYTYTYSTCATGENTCKYGCDSCYDSCYTTEQVANGCNSCTCCDYEPSYKCTGYCSENCNAWACGISANCVSCSTTYTNKCNSCTNCNICGTNYTTQCVGDYYSCRCSSCKTGSNTCKGGWNL